MTPKAGPKYSPDEEDRYRAYVARQDKQTRKIGQDVELSSDRLIIRDSVTGFRYAVEIQSGVIVLVAL